MLKLVKTELWKLKRYSVIWIGVAAMLSVVLLTRFMAIAIDGVYTLANFSDDVIWNTFTLIYPATITLIAGYTMERERTDDTLKNLLALPVSFRQLLVGKLLTTGLIAVALAIIEFVFTLAISFLSGFAGFEINTSVHSLFQMIGMNLCVYIAVLPIIAFTAQRAGIFMAGVAFAFFYGFVGTFAAGHGLTSLYPISAGLGLINYQGGGAAGMFNRPLCFIVILLMMVFSAIIVSCSHNRDRRIQCKI